MPDPKDAKKDETGKPGVVGNAIERTDNGFAGKPDDERLIGEDVPLEEQDAEEEEDRP
ncbi:hypothetical protein [Jiella marina]|uniref:hypothetical protein n=1 Tax=Jiella sp. LLJ827 TaxID=2917712 RepID=UPI0021007900|nr:hypothetical protein [Jiella sp. LLJ827]MCQ0988617.1 hypothetical protein [Jiella sp. LLJ827]